MISTVFAIIILFFVFKIKIGESALDGEWGRARSVKGNQVISRYL
jgi:hypothetical protein